MKIVGKDKAYFKTNGQSSNVCGKERRYREFAFLTSLISVFLTHCNVHDPECNIHDRGMTPLRTFINWAACDVA